MCDLCTEEMMEGALPVSEFSEYGCPHYDESQSRRAFCIEFLMQELPFLGALNKLLAHDDPNWLEDLQRRDVACVKLEYNNDLDPCPDLIIRLTHNADIVKSKNGNKSIKEVVTGYVKSRNLEATSTPYGSDLHFQLLISGLCVE